MSNIAINLWFTDQAEAAAQFYTSIFPNSSIGAVSRYPDAGQEVTGQAAGTVMTVAFDLDGQAFVALNGGDAGFHFDESVSFIVNCKDQAEVDRYWDALTADGGQESQCGWLKDKYGVSWQIIPDGMDEMLGDPDPEKAKRAMTAMLKMHKIDLAELQRAKDSAEPINA